MACGYPASADYVAMADQCPACRAQPFVEACGESMHKACSCVRPAGHDGEHNCIYPAGAPADELGAAAREAGA